MYVLSAEPCRSQMDSPRVIAYTATVKFKAVGPKSVAFSDNASKTGLPDRTAYRTSGVVNVTPDTVKPARME